MPIYEYRCPNGHLFELFQKIGDAPPEKCEVCGEGPLERVLYPVAVHFKGSGFYTTDYGRGSGKKPVEGRRLHVVRARQAQGREEKGRRGLAAEAAGWVGVARRRRAAARADLPSTIRITFALSSLGVMSPPVEVPPRRQ